MSRHSVRRVLSIGKLTGGAGSALYYEQSVASGREDYYSGRGEASGEWTGTGAQSLGLSGAVEAGQLETLLTGAHPQTGLPLRATETTVQGFDLTFSAPKSVSVFYAAGGESVREAIVSAHESAVRDALGYLEREAVQVRRGRNGVVKEHAGGLVAAAYRHRTSRAGDPQLHTHVVAANLAQGADGRWTALHGAPLYSHAKTAGFLYQAALRGRLARELGVEWTPVVNGSAEVAGMPVGVLEEFSQRRAEIRQAMAERGVSGARAASVAALDTRRAKDYDVAESSIYERWQARAAEHGLTREHLAGLLDRALSEELSAADLGRAAAFMAGEHGLTHEASTFSRREALQAWAAEHQQGANIDRLEGLADRWLASELVVRVDGDQAPVVRGQTIATRRGVRVVDHEARYSTPDMLATERALVAGATARVGEGAGLATPDAIDAALTARPYLADEQAAMVRALTTSGDGVQVVLAKAGAGKTTALDAARDAWQRSGRTVHGTALGSYATKELSDAGIDACTTARLMLDVERHGLTPGSVLIVDEAGMVGTRDLARLADHARRAHAKLVLVGDDHQLPEIDAGGAFRGLAHRLGAIELHDNRRQLDPEDRAALDAYRAGQPDALIDSLRQRGQILLAPDVEQTRQALVRDWWNGAQEAGVENVAMIALRRSEVRALNDLARGEMRDAGHLDEREVVIHGDRAFAAGDRIVTRQNAPRLGVVNGSRGEVLSIEDDGSMRVRLNEGKLVELPADYVTSQRRGQPYVDHGYAITANSIQGGTTSRAYVLGSDDLYREWGYTAFTRHRHELRFYVTAPDLPDHERQKLGPEPDPLAQIKQALGQSHAKTLAIDTRAADELRAMPHDRLLTEAAHLRDALDNAPAAARIALDRIDSDRTDASAELGRLANAIERTQHALQHAHRRDRPILRQRLADQQHTLATWQDRAAALNDQRAAVIDQAGDPDAWLHQHRAHIARLAAVETELHRRQQITQVEAMRRLTIDPPRYVTDELGPRPDQPTTRRAWDRGSRAIEDYRRTHGRSIPHDRSGLGDRPTDAGHRRAHIAATRQLDHAKIERRAPDAPSPADFNLDIGP